MPKVDIDPATGMPIVVADDDKTPISDFVASVPVALVTPIIPLPTDAIKVEQPKTTLVGMPNKIAEAEKFNARLKTPIPQATSILPVDQHPGINKDVELMSILKRFGMDSQQQGKAFVEIKALFE